MRLPRGLSGSDLVKGLGRVDYAISRQKGSHVQLTTQVNGEHHVTVPLHDPVRVGTLALILDSVASHLRMTRDELLNAMKV
ncbi:MAG TPA: type II toxin-antitoxin system HicA family toxin [Tepidisphaeraceae bacterium]|jgi:predicted RNA binding protein YcfA (HicA-like mRNA interferase family)|nr:type II toxin-antitoxin system HicA family toxin [Tepidisphaeraceae bacterium]